MIYRSRRHQPNKFIVSAIIFFSLTFLALQLTRGKEKVTIPQVLKGYISNSDEKGYFKNYTKISDPEPFWEPDETTSSTNPDLIAGFSGIIVDTSNGKTIFKKNANVKMKIASLTKVMTAVVALEHETPDKVITVSEKAASIGENAMGISRGEKYTLDELMYGLVLASGNDAAYAIAEGTAGDADTFVKWMNIKAKELGLHDTQFYDPSGLDDRSFSTAEDLVKLSRYALKSAEIRKIAKTEHMVLNTETHKFIELYNQTNLLTTYPGVEGFKTGYTEEAGYCLITNARNNGHELVGVILNSIDRRGDMILMLDYAFGTFGIKIEHHLL